MLQTTLSFSKSKLNTCSASLKKNKQIFSIQSRTSSSIVRPTPPTQISSTTLSTQTRRPQTNYNYIINHNNIATPATSATTTTTTAAAAATAMSDLNQVFQGPNATLFNPMAASMMMFMMQQHFMTTMMAAAGLPQIPTTPIAPPPPPPPPPASTIEPDSTSKKTNVDRITRFWL